MDWVNEVLNLPGEMLRKIFLKRFLSWMIFFVFRISCPDLVVIEINFKIELI